MLKRKLKIIIGINDFLVGGAQRLIVGQLKYINKENFEVNLVTLQSFDKQNMLKLVPEDVKISQFNFKRIFNCLEFIKLYRQIRLYKPDVVVSHLFFSNCVFSILKPFCGYKLIIVEHNTYIYRKFFEILANRILSYFVFKIIAVSDTVESFSIKQTGINKSKFVVIRNGLDLVNIKNYINENYNRRIDIREKLGIGPEKVLAINVGRLTMQKNQELLVESFSRFSGSNGEVTLLVLGEGEQRENLQSQIDKLGLSDKVILVGAKNNIYDYLFASDFMVSTSIIEGFSMAYLEAQAFGLPLLATKTAGTDELIKDGFNGFFIESSVESISEGLEKMVAVDRVKMANNSRLIADDYDIIKNISAYENLIIKSINE